MKKYTAEDIRLAMERHIAANSGKRALTATKFEKWVALTRTMLEIAGLDWHDTTKMYNTGRQAHYLSAEFLVGRSLVNNLVNMGLLEEAKTALSDLGDSLESIEEAELDPGLGNGGLGRLAACFLDSCATLDMPVTGYGILYRYGLFRQSIENGFQKEYPDTWREDGYPWTIRRSEETVTVRYDDMNVNALPFDLPITGYGTRNVNTLRLWMARPAEEFDFGLFNSQRFDDALLGRNRVNDIWRVLYPNDTSYDGKVLRLRQQYFFSSASLQDIVRKHKQYISEDLSDFDKFHTIQLNDTHPVIAIPELMRILTEENGMEWNKAWGITQRTFAYTNHTILSEALEKWEIGIFEFLFKGIYRIIERINAQLCLELQQKGLFQDKIDRLAIIGDSRVRMAWLAIYGSKSVNGVAELHTNLLKQTVLSEWYELWPEKFNNKTNGVTPRRWLVKSNPMLSDLLTELVDSKDWIRNLDLLSGLSKYADSKEVMDSFMRIKRSAKERLAVYIKEATGIEVNPDSLFDIQIKRLHEYKRQLMNALSILDLYYSIKDNPEMKVVPRTFIFAAKAAPGYFRAKGVIKLINEIARLVNNDPIVSEKVKVVFLPNYNISLAEKLFPAADVSEQISLAGLEASGTGNMKFMINGAVTHGTYDGANVEIVREAGWENEFIFGARVEHLPDIMGFYNPKWQYENVPGLKRAVDALIDKTLDDSGTGMFRDIYNALLYGSGSQRADFYYVLGDFEDYRKSRAKVDEAFQDKYKFAAMCWKNVCASGIFSSDRTIKEYSDEIWEIEPKPLK